jgi:homoserine O-acetyltransferase
LRIDEALFKENERTAPTFEHRQFCSIGPMQCEFGGTIDAVTVAYETWGTLSSNKDNAVLICHALSGDSHAVGWWDRMVGEGKPIDTTKYFVIGTNCLGGCQGTTGPSSAAPDGTRYNVRFPIITIGDMVEAQAMLVSALGIDRLYTVAGGSMGGMQALEWALRFPNRVRKAFVAASCAAHTAMQIGFNEVARQAVMRDPKWKGGNYDPSDPPANGLSVARMVGHLTYLSEASFDHKFSRRTQGKSQPEGTLGVEFEVESYLSYQGDKFAKRFDANSLLYLTRAIDYFERLDNWNTDTEFLFTSFKSDWIYPSWQSEQMHQKALHGGCKSRWHDIDLPFGHDSFLLDGEIQGQAVRAFLDDC